MMKTSTHKEGHAVSPAELEAQAWSWLRLLTSGDAKALDAQRFRRWVQASPAHQAAYSTVKLRWDAIEAPARELQRLKPEAAVLHKRVPGAPQWSRRAFLGAAASAAAAGGVAVVYPPLGLWPALAEWDADDQTRAGEQRTLMLAASVSVTLNTRTSVRRQMNGGETVGLDLINGEAAVDLNGAGRVFAVAAGAGNSLAESGQFEVRNLDGRVCVTCIGGSVRVEHPAGSRTLKAGQQTIYDAKALSGVGNVNLADVSAWRKGLLVFNQTRLSDVLDEINRYRPGLVLLVNDSVRNKPVSGRFVIASLDVALWQLQEVFGLNARVLPGGLLVLS
ncbi:FecR family protein [Cupriavidus basilensis]|uniref:DUF4880 domain-containing protein n=1 Tax=Cupriavidus basilensis TaxID=68895 RepID=A0A643FZ16_9BURK|nr:DUF4880 domain-containing protein [Cupriavidus basilensis]QOT82000.1 DUF4880 domain-containing protein [Cupriavidus basilensis]